MTMYIQIEAQKKKLKDFTSFIEMVTKNDFRKLLEFVTVDYLVRTKQVRIAKKTDQINIPQETSENITKNIFIGCFKSQFVGGGTVYDAILEIKEHIDVYSKLYEILEDKRSKETLQYILYHKFFGDERYFAKSYCPDAQYYRPELLRTRENGVFVDCGAFDGETVKQYIETYGTYQKIYAYEPVPENIEKVRENLSHFDNVICRHAGVSNKSGTMTFTSHMPGTANRLHPNGDKIVDVVTIDEDIPERIDFIKMDIESAEPDALIGAKGHIQKDKPELAVCVYHTISDLRVIFEIIYEINTQQRFNLRHHNNHNCEEIVLYVSPL